ncbi:MAG: transposase, partial [Chlamydiota bacterium]
LRNIGGRFYLYRVSSKWNKEKKVTQKITHELIGRITEEDGLIPKGTKKHKEEKSTFSIASLAKISTRESGASNYLTSISGDILSGLCKHFPDHFREIYALALGRLLHQSPLKNMSFLYESSMLSEQFKDLDLTKNNLTTFMRELGSDRTAIADFMQDFVQGTNNIVFDTTHSISQSGKMQLNQVGYNSTGSYEPQVNLFYMFATEQQMPAYYRIFPGNISGMKALKLTIKEAGIKDACMVGDKGFSSDDNMNMFDEEDLQYVLPLKRNSRFVRYDRLTTREYDQAFDGHFMHHNRPIFYYKYIYSEKKNEQIKERNIVVFHDPRLRNEEEASYLRRTENENPDYTMDGFKEKQIAFGTMAMIYSLKSTEIDKDGNPVEVSAQKIYEKYKSRMEVETVFDTYKNLLQADRSYMQSDEAFEAWVFLNHIAIMLYYKIFNVIKDKNKLGKLSPKDLLMRLTRVTKIRIGAEWVTAEVPRSSQIIFKELGITVT